MDFTGYDIVFLAGGWGAAYDLGTSSVLGEGISRAWAAGRVVGGVCHGPLGLLLALDETGQPLVRVFGSQEQFDRLRPTIERAITFQDEPPTVGPLIVERVV